ncbi:MAG: polysaccharide deacetylase family protein [Pseudorhodobacter sp.]|nr:polysaccharide deacetylase family protein [Pseudorhodobacter sp.]
MPGRGSRYRLSILGYHAVTADPSPLNDWCYLDVEKFAQQMRWLADQPLDVLPLNDAVRAMAQGQLRRNTVALTFDDGYRNNIKVALPVLLHHSFAATIFVSTGPIGTTRTLWHGRIISALERSAKAAIDWYGARHDLTTADARRRANVRLQAQVKLHAAANPDAAAAEIELLLDVPEVVAHPDTSPHAMLSPDDIHLAQDSGLISFGAHTVTHPLLSALDDTRLADEIIGSVDTLAALTGQPCTNFAYPNGRDCDYDDRAVALLRNCGIDAAVSTTNGPNYSGADLMRLRRWNIGQSTRFAVFKAKLRGHHPAALRASLRYWGALRLF